METMRANGTQGAKKIRFQKIPQLIDVPNLIELQRSSYEKFLIEGIREAFIDISPIEDFTGNLILEFLDHSLGEPTHSIEECQDKDMTFARPLKVKVRLITKQEGEIKEVKEQEIFMGDFPCMTNKGTFVINGAERVIVSQLVRSPGIYYQKVTDPTGKLLYNGMVIPNRGAWLEYESDLSDTIGVRIDKTRKIQATVLLKAIRNDYYKETFKQEYDDLDRLKDRLKERKEGDKKEVEGLIDKQKKLIKAKIEDDIRELFLQEPVIEETLAKDDVVDGDEALIEIYRKLRPGDPPSVDSSRTLLRNLFFDPKRYNLAKVGRHKLNKKLGLKLVCSHCGSFNNMPKDLKCNECGSTLDYLEILTREDMILSIRFHAALVRGDRKMKLPLEGFSLPEFKFTREEKEIIEKLIKGKISEDLHTLADIRKLISKCSRINRLNKLLGRLKSLSCPNCGLTEVGEYKLACPECSTPLKYLTEPSQEDAKTKKAHVQEDRMALELLAMYVLAEKSTMADVEDLYINLDIKPGFSKDEKG